jgi:AraC-like DNA-binding protein
MNSIIVRANEYQFRAKEKVRNSCVQSIMLLWCINGKGIVNVNRENYNISPGQFLLLPWGHDVVYASDGKEPLFVAGIHYIPDLPLSVNLKFDESMPESGNDANLSKKISYLFTDVITGCKNESPSLIQLATYIVTTFQRGNMKEWLARQLGEMFEIELNYYLKFNKNKISIPDRLQLILSYMTKHLNKTITMSDIANYADCSTSTLTRLFQKYLNKSPGQWLQEERLKQAAMLIATTILPFSEIGKRVGIDDQFYFSKIFKQHSGMTPTAYRRSNILMSNNI